MSALSDNDFTSLCAGGSAEQVRRALAEGASVHAKGRFLGHSALVYAARWNPDPEVSRVLLDAGADTRLTDPVNDVALDYACLGGNTCGYCAAPRRRGGNRALQWR